MCAARGGKPWQAWRPQRRNSGDERGQRRYTQLWRAVTANRKVTLGSDRRRLLHAAGDLRAVLHRVRRQRLRTDRSAPPSGAALARHDRLWPGCLAQVVVGARVSVALGFSTGVIATIIAVIVGLVSGYFGGWLDEVLSVFTNVFLVLPALPLAIVLAAFLPYKGPLTIGFVLVVTGWSWGARVLRAQTLSMRNREFVTAARPAASQPGASSSSRSCPTDRRRRRAASGHGHLRHSGRSGAGISRPGRLRGVSWGTMLYWAGNKMRCCWAPGGGSFRPASASRSSAPGWPSSTSASTRSPIPACARSRSGSVGRAQVAKEA